MKLVKVVELGNTHAAADSDNELREMTSFWKPQNMVKCCHSSTLTQPGHSCTVERGGKAVPAANDKRRNEEEGREIGILAPDDQALMSHESDTFSCFTMYLGGEVQHELSHLDILVISLNTY